MSNCTASPSGVAVGVGRIPASHPEGYGYSWFCERYQHRRRHLDVVLRQEPKAGEKMYVDWVTTDHTEIGRIQGRQMAALLPHGGMALYLESPAVSQALQQRKCGMLETKPDDIQMRTIRSQCDKQDAATAVPSWLRLSTSQQAKYDLVAAQRDSMAIGAREALTSETLSSQREHWLSVPFLGCDGCKNTGQV